MSLSRCYSPGKWTSIKVAFGARPVLIAYNVWVSPAGVKYEGPPIGAY